MSKVKYLIIEQNGQEEPKHYHDHCMDIDGELIGECCCQEIVNHQGRTWMCTRPPKHKGAHEAGNEDGVCARWTDKNKEMVQTMGAL